MSEDETPKRSIFDLSRYSETTRKVIFGVIAAVLLGVAAFAMFVVSPQQAAKTAETSPDVRATQAPVNNESSPTAAPTASPVPAQTYTNGAYPTDEQDAARQAQQKIVASSTAEPKPTGVDNDPVVQDGPALVKIASQGMLEYCTDNPGETKEQKQARMKPYFHTDISSYNSPQTGIFYVTKCSLGGTDMPTPASTPGQYIVHVGIAWGAQYQKDSSANTGYTQYTVTLDKNGIVGFDD